MKLRIFVLMLLMLCFVQTATAGVNLEVVYPHSLEKKDTPIVYGSSTVPLYINLTSFDVPWEQNITVKIYLPAGFTSLESPGWHADNSSGVDVISRDWILPADYGQNFDLLYIQAQDNTLYGKQQILVEVTSEQWQIDKTIEFTYDPKFDGNNILTEHEKKIDKSRYNWYIQSVNLPVDSLGHKNDNEEAGVIYVRDTSLEGLRNRIIGDGATNWAKVFNHPATYLFLDMRNPQRDIRMLKFKAELLDKTTGEVIPSLCNVGKSNEDAEYGWAGDTGSGDETTALISLDGDKSQAFIIPLYIDYFKVLAGDYTLRITVSGNKQEKIQELPLRIAKKHNMGFIAVSIAGSCLLLFVVFSYKLRQCIITIGAKGAITVALFATIVFGGIVLPTTILGDLLNVFLGPFSGLVTGILSGVLQYLLIMSLLVLFRVRGVLTLMFIIKFMLSGLMLGNFSPLGILICCVNMVILELTLFSSGFYQRKDLTNKYMIGISVALGISDALITFINLEQMMFFYRLYYADWYIGLYMLVNGFIYSSIGSWMGYKTGLKMQQVMGE